MLQSYTRLIEYANAKNIPLGLSYDVYLETFDNLGYSDVATYEADNIAALSSQKVATLDNYLDISPLLFHEVEPSDDSHISPDDMLDNVVSEIEESEDSSTEASLQESYERVCKYIRENRIFASITFDNYIAQFEELQLPTIEEYENLVCSVMVKDSVPKSNSSDQWFNNTGVSMPFKATYATYSLLSEVHKGDFFFEGVGIASYTGHIGIIEGRFYDVTRKQFYLRCVEAVSSGVKRGIIDDTRVNTMGCLLYTIPSADSGKRHRAIQFCLSQLNKTWSLDWLAKNTASTTNVWYCSELVWAAYYNQGIDLDGGVLPGVLPIEMKASPYAQNYSFDASNRPSNYLQDISTHWGYSYITYMTNNGLIETEGRYFQPNSTASRALVVVAIHRMEGEPYISNNSFSDVYSWDSYRDAVAWGASKNIVTGTSSNTFSPNSSVKRQDFVTFLYRYAKLKNYSTTYSATALNPFSDRAQVDSYAQEAMKWAVGKGIISGRTSTTLAPKSTTTKAEAACMLHRFIQKIVK